MSFDEYNPMVKDLENVMLFFPSSIDTGYAAARGAEITPLFYSTDKAKLQSGRYDIKPPEKLNQAEYTDGPYVMGAAVSGAFDSWFKDRQIPEGDSAAVAPPDVEVIPNSPQTRLVVVGDGHLAQDMYLGDPSNLAFLLNMVDWLAGEEDLIHIRTRDVTSRPLAELATGVKTTIKYANIFAPPALVIIIGLIRWQVRRRRKNVEL